MAHYNRRIIPPSQLDADVRRGTPPAGRNPGVMHHGVWYGGATNGPHARWLNAMTAAHRATLTEVLPGSCFLGRHPGCHRCRPYVAWQHRIDDDLRDEPCRTRRHGDTTPGHRGDQAAWIGSGVVVVVAALAIWADAPVASPTLLVVPGLLANLLLTLLLILTVTVRVADVAAAVCPRVVRAAGSSWTAVHRAVWIAYDRALLTAHQPDPAPAPAAAAWKPNGLPDVERGGVDAAVRADLADPAWWHREGCRNTAALMSGVGTVDGSRFDPGPAPTADPPAYVPGEVGMAPGQAAAVRAAAGFVEHHHTPELLSSDTAAPRRRGSKYGAVAAACRANPGAWTELTPFVSPAAARAFTLAVTRGRRAAFKGDGVWETEQDQKTVRVRFLRDDTGCTCRTCDDLAGEPFRVHTLEDAPCPVHDDTVPIADPDTGELLGAVAVDPVTRDATGIHPTTTTPCPFCGDLATYATPDAAVYTAPTGHRDDGSGIIACPRGGRWRRAGDGRIRILEETDRVAIACPFCGDPTLWRNPDDGQPWVTVGHTAAALTPHRIGLVTCPTGGKFRRSPSWTRDHGFAHVLTAATRPRCGGERCALLLTPDRDAVVGAVHYPPCRHAVPDGPTERP